MQFKTPDCSSVDLGFSSYTCESSIHFAGFYETTEERDNLVMPFLKQGIDDGHINIYCPADESKENFSQRMDVFYNHTIPSDSLEKNMMIKNISELYMQNGTFSAKEMCNNLSKVWKEYANYENPVLRISGDMKWAINNAIDLNELALYESLVNDFIKDKPWICICLYDLTEFPGEGIMQIFKTHPYIITKEAQILENPYYQEPSLFIKQNSLDKMD